MKTNLRILAHRGARTEAPENTLAAFRRAFELGADGIELDVRCCADGELIVIHDSSVDLLSNGIGQVGSLTLHQIQSLDFGIAFDPRFAGETAPTLSQVLDELPSKAYLNIEIKNDDLRTHGEEQQVVRLIRRYQLTDRVVVSSFNPLVLRRIRRLDPTIPIGWLYEARTPIYLRPQPLLTFLRPQALHPHFKVVTRDMVTEAHRRGFQVNVWTVNQIEDMCRLIDWGVDALITDYPDRARQLI